MKSGRENDQESDINGNAMIAGKPALRSSRGDAQPNAKASESSGQKSPCWRVKRKTLIKKGNLSMISPWMYWMVGLALIQPSLLAVEKADPALIPSIFSPESSPAHAISHLADFVLVITGVIFLIVGGLLVYALVRFRRRADDDE